MKKKRKNRSELNRKYSLISVGTVLLCIAIFSVVQFVFMDDIFLESARFRMSVAANDIAEIDFESKDYEKELYDIETNRNLYLEIYYPRDTLIYTTKNNSVGNEAQTEKTELKPRIMKILSRTENDDGSYFEIRKEYFASAQYIVYGCFFEDDMALEIYYSLDSVNENSELASRVFFYLCLIIMFMIITLSIKIGFMVFAPLRNMINITKRMANMDFSAKCPRYDINDLNELSASINTLGTSLSRALGNLQSENKKLETDIQYERRQEKIRKSFISNVSHELKTPIAIIKGYAEGMKMGIGGDNPDEICDIIIDEADKMNNLIVRLMEYMKLSSGAYKLYSSVFNLREMADEWAENHKMKMQREGIEFICDIDPEFTCYSDVMMMENIFLNYLSNAISHIDNEKIIKVTAEDKGKSYRVRVFNTGKPIPGTDIENIWQSFYRADKAHSREEGRFGLGLSFVATIQDMSGEKYGVENKPNGVEFWFDVKKKQ
jgi:signal transduction histidine kinase